MKRKIEMMITVPVEIVKEDDGNPADKQIFFCYVDVNGSKRVVGRGENELDALTDMKAEMAAYFKTLWW